MSTVGTKAQAREVRGRNLQLLYGADAQWALDEHVKRNDLVTLSRWQAMALSQRAGHEPDDRIVRAVLMTGNEDSPEEIWISREDPTLVTTEVELVYVAPGS